MLLFIIIQLAESSSIFKFNKNETIISLPNTFDFKKGGDYSLRIKNRGINSFYIHIGTDEDINRLKKTLETINPCQNETGFENAHFIRLQNGLGEIRGKIVKDGVYKAIIKSCMPNHDELIVELKYNSPISNKLKSKLCYRIIIGISSVTFLLYILWLINWFINFSMKNIIHLLLTLSFTLFTIEKILYILDYSINNMSDKNNQKIEIAHYVFLALSNFLFMFSVSLYIHGFGVFYERPRIYAFFICLVISILAGLCPIINHIAYPIIIYFVFLTGLYSYWRKKQSDESKKYYVFVSIVFTIYCQFYFYGLLVMTAIDEIREYDLKVYLILKIIELFGIFLIGIALRMTKNNKINYQYFYIYSIYNVDTKYQSRDNNITQLYDIKNHVFSYSSFTKFTILENVAEIGDYSFYDSRNLVQINFSNNTILKRIGSNAFSRCPIKKMTIPSSVREIGSNAFSNCAKLESIDFGNNSELMSIKNNTFYESSIESLEIPANVAILEDEWCHGTPNLNNIYLSLYNSHFILYENNLILGKINLNRENYEILYFAKRNIKHVNVPSFILCIFSFAFENCKSLQKINFASDSHLRKIKKGSFKYSGINEIKIPISVKKICDGAFQYTNQLRNVIFPEKSQLRKIAKETFSYSGIECISLPASVIIIQKNAFSNCSNLRKIQFTNDSKLRIIEENAFSNSAISSFSVPQTVVEIRDNAFDMCKNLVCVEITEKSDMCSLNLKSFTNINSVILFVPHPLIKFLTI